MAPATTDQTRKAEQPEQPTKAQPWKAEWPPKTVSAETPAHGCPAGTVLYENGDTVSKPKDREGDQTPASSEPSST